MNYLISRHGTFLFFFFFNRASLHQRLPFKYIYIPEINLNSLWHVVSEPTLASLLEFKLNSVLTMCIYSA